MVSKELVTMPSVYGPHEDSSPAYAFSGPPERRQYLGTRSHERAVLAYTCELLRRGR